MQMNNMYSNYKIKIVEGMNDEYLSDMFNGSNTIYVKPGVYAMSTRKINSLIKIAEIQKYYQCNPVRFINDFFNIELATYHPHTTFITTFLLIFFL